LQYNNFEQMGASKSESFSEEHNEIATLFKALSHPARIAIVDYLLSVEACICGDIVNELPLAQPTVSQHLKELKNANIIKGTIEGTAICYCINSDTIDKIENHFGIIRHKLKNKCC
jgi:ArsR family transcriptional regulator, arsenate/arsenite/antimonite-responsive transcriptional repressor